MKNSPLTIRKTECAISTTELARYADGWLLTCDIARHSEPTLKLRRLILNKLLWFLREKCVDTCGLHELRLFFSYLNHGHEQPGGRWGNPQQTKPVKPGTVVTYDRHLRTFFAWLVQEEVLEGSPMERITEPIDRPDQIEPFSDEEVETLIAAAKKSNSPSVMRLSSGFSWILVCGRRNSVLSCYRTLTSPPER